MIDKEKTLRILQIAEELKRRKSQQKIDSFYPDEGPLRREFYPKHLEFFAAGTKHIERLALCANRVGKSVGMGGYETTLHLTGDYPDWWPGRRFKKPVDWWAAGDTGLTTRDIIQFILLGPLNEMGTGLIPGKKIVNTTPRAGIPEAVDTVYVKHRSGGVSKLGLKSYDQKRRSFQGTKKQGIWLDEEPALPIYSECLLRVMDTSGGNENGLMLATFTPLLGLSDVVLMFLPDGSLENVNV